MPSRGRAALGAIAVAALFLLPLLPEALGRRRLVFRDAQITHWPWRRVATASLAQGEVPFVNAFASGGQPMLANPNAVLLYPTFLLEKALPPSAAFNWHYLLHVLWAFFGARLLARRMGLSEGPALFAGVAFAFSGMLLSYGSAFMNSCAAASWLPWCAAATLDLARARRLRAILRSSAAAGLGLGLQLLAGEPALSLLTLAFIMVLAVAEMLAGKVASDRTRSLRALLLGGPLAGLLALGLAAPLVLPLWKVFPYTYRGLHLYSEKAFGAAPFTPARAIEWLLPRFGGDPGVMGGGAGWLRPGSQGNFVYIWCLTFGVIPLVILLVASVRRDFWHRKTYTLAAAGLVTLLFSVGFALPFYRLLYSVEALRRLRYPIKFYLLTTLCVALLAGFAAESLRRRMEGRARREAAVLAAVLVLFVAAWIAAGEGGLLEARVRPILDQMSSPPSGFLPAFRTAVRGDALLGGAATLFVGLLVLWHRRPRGLGQILGISTLLFALVWGLPLFVSASDKELARPPALFQALRGAGRLHVSRELPRVDVPALEKASDHPAKLPRVAHASRVFAEQLIPLSAARYGVRYLFENDPDGSYGYFNRLASEVFDASTPAEKSRLLRAYGGRWVLSEESVTYPFAHPVTGFSVAGTRLLLQELPNPVAEVRWAGRTHRRRSLSGALELVRSERFDPGSEVVLSARSDSGPSGENRPATVAIESLRADRTSALVTASDPGHLLFSRTYFPVWRASLDGVSTPVRVANARDLAVAVPPGRHRVELWYDREPFHRGVFLQAATLLLVALAALLLRKRNPLRPG